MSDDLSVNWKLFFGWAGVVISLATLIWYVWSFFHSEAGRNKNNSHIGSDPSASQKRFLNWNWTGVVIPLAGLIWGIYTFRHTEAVKNAEAEKNQTYGACSLKPSTPASVSRLNNFVKEGQYYKATSKLDLAEHRFQQVLDIDPHYLGANLNLGVVQMTKGDLKRAEASLEAELKVIDCFRSVPEGELGRFGYWLGSNKNMKVDDSAVRQQLDEVEDSVHYNMACAFSKQKDQTTALDELRKATEHHSISRAVVVQDPDLRSVRNQVGYSSILAHFN